MTADALRERYLELTTEVLPAQATAAWPVQADHCFQRIVLDNLFGDVWYDHVDRPAYTHLSRRQLQAATRLAASMVSDPDRVRELNRLSLTYRQATDDSPEETQQTLDAF